MHWVFYYYILIYKVIKIYFQNNIYNYIFQKTIKKEIKDVWLYFYLINISEQLNKFISNNWFEKTIIKVNK